MVGLPMIKVGFALIRQITRPLVHKIVVSSHDHPAVKAGLMKIGWLQFYASAWTRQFVEKQEAKDEAELKAAEAMMKEQKTAAELTPEELEKLNEKNAEQAKERAMAALEKPSAIAVEGPPLPDKATTEKDVPKTIEEIEIEKRIEAEKRLEAEARAKKAASEALYGIVTGLGAEVKKDFLREKAKVVFNSTLAVAQLKSRKPLPLPSDAELIQRGSKLIVEVVVFSITLFLLAWEWQQSKLGEAKKQAALRAKLVRIEQRLTMLENEILEPHDNCEQKKQEQAPSNSETQDPDNKDEKTLIEKENKPTSENDAPPPAPSNLSQNGKTKVRPALTDFTGSAVFVSNLKSDVTTTSAVKIEEGTEVIVVDALPVRKLRQDLAAAKQVVASSLGNGKIVDSSPSTEEKLPK